MRDDSDLEAGKKLVLVVNEDAISFLDPLSVAQGAKTVAFLRLKWPVVASVTSKADTVTIITKEQRKMFIIGSASEIVAEISRARDAHKVSDFSQGDDEEVEVMSW